MSRAEAIFSTSPAFIVIKAAAEFKDKTTAPNQLWQRAQGQWEPVAIKTEDKTVDAEDPSDIALIKDRSSARFRSGSIETASGASLCRLLTASRTFLLRRPFGL
jgi:hypothetical protein